MSSLKPEEPAAKNPEPTEPPNDSIKTGSEEKSELNSNDQTNDPDHLLPSDLAKLASLDTSLAMMSSAPSTSTKKWVTSNMCALLLTVNNPPNKRLGQK